MKHQAQAERSMWYQGGGRTSLAVGILALTACAVPHPPGELLDARLALQDAKSANADKRATRSYDMAAAYLVAVNKSWERDHDASAILHQARLAEAEARKAQYAAEAQLAEEELRRQNDRKTRNALILRDAEIMALRKKGQEEELQRMKALAGSQEQALIQAKEKEDAERVRVEREITRLREEQEQFAAQVAESAAAERAAARAHVEHDNRVALEAEQARADLAEREVERLRENQQKEAAERASAEQAAARIHEEQERQAALAVQQARAAQAEYEVSRLRAEQDKMRAELTSTLSGLTKVREEARGMIVTLPGSIYFNVSQADVKPAMQRQVAKIAKALAAVPEQHFLIEGHTDSDGSSESNLVLSESRAQSVRRILQGEGIPAERMEVKGYGKSNPIADNSTHAGKAQNRRVEIVLVPMR